MHASGSKTKTRLHRGCPGAKATGRRPSSPLGASVLMVFSVICAAPAGAAAPAASIETCFAPESDCAAFAVRTIDRAEREILVGAYGLTTGSGIVEALVLAKERYTDLLDRSGGIRAHIGLNYCRAFRTARGI